ncbi:cupin domain-containing protein [Lysinibacillus sp. 2017]|uniref:cupin domain-containing protein n=1 Tax=unclassified Lysinibacillus TaxID=2636778 RepID=UPI000D52A645|nr:MULTISPECIES: cupin domain-containing protein [unclassified Lysinibacillus]AWE07285.1 cupin domain-containing protein [Lysinibacillus sp. 2017]TGN30808.1 cupin domain-containing protein [Lysinibacillus sp. S2017]
MYYMPYTYQYPNYSNGPTHPQGNPTGYWAVPNELPFGSYQYGDGGNLLKDYGANPFVININEATKQNNTYRTALWTGNHLQVTLMSINVGEDVGLEIHPNVDQFLRVEQGQGIVQMGKSKDNLSFQCRIFDDSAIIIPSGMWHNVTNTGNIPLKLYSIYAPPNHPFGTVHKTKTDAMIMEAGLGEPH